MTTADPGSLHRIPLFRGLNPAELAEVGGLLQRRSVPAETVIVREDEPGEAVCVIGNGFVRVQVDQADGASTILAMLGPNEVVGEMSLADRLGRSATVVAHGPLSHYWMNRVAFSACLRSTPALACNLAAILSCRLRRANEQIAALATLGVDGRIARQLLIFAEDFGEVLPCGVRIPFSLSQTEVADLVGASRVRVNQVLMDYRRRGYIASDDRGRFVLRDRPALGDRCWQPWLARALPRRDGPSTANPHQGSRV